MLQRYVIRLLPHTAPLSFPEIILFVQYVSILLLIVFFLFAAVT